MEGDLFLLNLFKTNLHFLGRRVGVQKSKDAPREGMILRQNLGMLHSNALFISGQNLGSRRKGSTTS